MTTSHEDESIPTPRSAGAQPPLSLSQLLTLARAHTIDEQRIALEQAHRGETPVAPPEGAPYLLFTCADVACAAPLTQFREVLPTLPTTVALPFSPPWMLGFFALHTELIGLVDPAPFLFESPDLATLSRARLRNGRVILPGSPSPSRENWRLAMPESGPTALIIGSGERMLALVVGRVGDVAYAKPGDISADADVASLPRAPATRFRAGVYREPGGQMAFSVLKMDVLLDTLLDALKVEAAGYE
ncbi:MAG TPA: chemotaxis protein CheW [Ktedonobacterales bacterium]